MGVSTLRLSIRKKGTLIIDGLLGNLAFIPWLQRQGIRRDHKPVTLDGFGVHVIGIHVIKENWFNQGQVQVPFGSGRCFRLVIVFVVNERSSGALRS